MKLFLSLFLVAFIAAAETPTSPRQALVVEDRPWPAGIESQMSSWAVMAGWLEQRGRQGLQLTAGLGAHTIKWKPTDEDNTSFSTFAGAAALEYHLALLRSSLPYEHALAHQWSVVLHARAGVEKAFERKHGVAPLVFLFQLGVGFDAWSYRRVER